MISGREDPRGDEAPIYEGDTGRLAL